MESWMEQPINQSVITLEGSGCDKRNKRNIWNLTEEHDATVNKKISIQIESRLSEFLYRILLFKVPIKNLVKSQPLFDVYQQYVLTFLIDLQVEVSRFRCRIFHCFAYFLKI